MNLSLVQKATNFAFLYHSNQWRKHSDLPYIIHPMQVLQTISGWGIHHDTTWIVALLHDTLEDTQILPDEILTNFGKDVLKYVQELTFQSHHKAQERKIAKNQYLKDFDQKNIVSLVVKIADRLCNTRDFLVGQQQYAKIYFHKADCLFEILRQRKQEVIDTYGNDVYSSMIYEIGELDGFLSCNSDVPNPQELVKKPFTLDDATCAIREMLLFGAENGSFLTLTSTKVLDNHIQIVLTHPEKHDVHATYTVIVSE